MIRCATSTGKIMPKKPNYSFEKRQKEMARKQKKEEKRARKRDDEPRPDEAPESTSDLPPTPPTE